MTMGMMGMKVDMKATFKTTADGKRFVMDMTVKAGDQEIPAHAVGDGENMWSELTMPNKQGKIVQKFSMKTLEKMGGGSQNPLGAVKELRERFAFTDAKEEKLGDTEVYVLEGRLREGIVERCVKNAGDVAGAQSAAMTRAQLESMDKARIYVRKDEMMFVKSEVFGRDGSVVVGIELSNLKRDIKIDEAEFKYTPPAGVQVMDMEEQFKTLRGAGQGVGEPKD
jgi:hypothetical protein